MKHVCKFEARRPDAKTLVCDCGKFRHVISEENPAIEGVAVKDLDAFTRAYLECALWSSHDETTGKGYDSRFDIMDFTEESRDSAIADCSKFQAENRADLGWRPDKGGFHFWLTRNHHGAGFWDADYPEDAGERLTAASHTFGELDILERDDGRIEFYPA